MTNLPAGWANTTLGNVVRHCRKTVDPASVRHMPFIGLNQVEQRTSRLLGILKASDVTSRVVLFRKGDILYARLRPYLNKVYEAEFDGSGSSEFIVLRPNSAIDGRYLVMIMRQRQFVEYASQRSTGDRPRVGIKTLQEFPFPLPPAEEQLRIIAKVDKLYQRTNNLRTSLDEIPHLLDRYRRCILTAAYRGHLIETSQTKVSHLVGTATPDNGILENEVPDHWQLRSLKDIADIRSGITLGQTRKRSDNLHEVPYLRVANVQRGYLDLEDVAILKATKPEIERFSLRRGDILMNEGGDRDKLGRGWVWEGQLQTCLYQNHIFRVRLYDIDYPARYILYYTNEFARDYFFSVGTQTTNLASMSKSNLAALSIPLAPREEANEVVSRLDQVVSHIQVLLEEYKCAQGLLDNFEEEIARTAASGQLLPQHPDDGPASLLLQRAKMDDKESQLRRKPSAKDNEERATRRRHGGTQMPLKTRSQVEEDHLRSVLQRLGGSATSLQLWRESEMDLDEFYKLLRTEVLIGRIAEGQAKGEVEICDAR